MRPIYCGEKSPLPLAPSRKGRGDSFAGGTDGGDWRAGLRLGELSAELACARDFFRYNRATVG
jgi:hypothetical protein